jgi:hypothetical protein
MTSSHPTPTPPPWPPQGSSTSLAAATSTASTWGPSWPAALSSSPSTSTAAGASARCTSHVSARRAARARPQRARADSAWSEGTSSTAPSAQLCTSPQPTSHHRTSTQDQPPAWHAARRPTPRSTRQSLAGHLPTAHVPAPCPCNTAPRPLLAKPILLAHPGHLPPRLPSCLPSILSAHPPRPSPLNPQP